MSRHQAPPRLHVALPFVTLSLASALACASCAAPTFEHRARDAAPAVAALRDGAFDRAAHEADGEIRADAQNPYAHLVRAITRYERSMHQTSLDLRTVVIGGFGAGAFNFKYLREALEKSESDLAAVEDDLAVAAKDPGLAIELCVACWEVDWNGNGRVDDRDRLVMQIERDEADRPIPEGDPRRKPTFRFDTGDVAWARAFVSFQRALVDVVLAYDWADLEGVIHSTRGRGEAWVLKLAHPDRVADARRRILEGLDRSDEARVLYLAETDDDREWVPNPRQKSHPMPLPVDQELYDTWEGVVGDLRRLVCSEEGLAVKDLVKLGDQDGGRVQNAPTGTIDIGGLLAHPRDISFTEHDLASLERLGDLDPGDAAGGLRALFGERYVASMRPSPLPGRLGRMKGEIDRHSEGLERKLRYLFWLN